MNFPLRNWLLPLHRWTGMTLGLVVAAMALTGAGIVFRPQLEPLVNRDLLTVPACIGRANVDTLVANASARHPGAAPDYVRLLAGDDAAPRVPAASVHFTDEQIVYLDPCTGSVVGQRHRWGGVLGTVEELHRFKFMPNGQWVGGTFALLFGTVLVLGGLYLWLPATLRGLRHAVRFNGRLNGPARTLSLHKTAGLYAAVIVLTSVSTGLPLAFGWYKHALYALAGSPPPPRAPQAQAPRGARLPLEQLWERAEKLTPHPREALIHVPLRADEAEEMYMIERDAPHPNARTMLYLDPYGGKVLSFSPYATSSAGNRLYFWFLSLHTGRIGGPAWQLVLMGGALTVPLLAYTGISGWLRRRRRGAQGRLALKVAAKTVEAQGICSFDLVLPSGGALPAFAAGAHIDVFLRDGSIRQYSLCNDPAETHRYQICVQREPQSRGGSRALHDEVKVGHRIEVGLPKPRFPLDPGARSSLLVAGGIGITPLISMAEQLSRDDAPFALHYCTRSRERTAFIDRIRQAPYAGKVFFHFSDGAPEQLVDLARLLTDPAPGAHLYVCGPAGFLNLVCDTAHEAGWPADHIHREYFSAEAAGTMDDRAFDIRLASSGKVLHVASGRSALEVLSAAGVDVARSCEKGVCGTCATRVLEGTPLHRDLYLNEEERCRNDQFMPCCSRAQGELLVLDL
ncbi:MAG: PepSY domain-containing protein [Telluria sp.]